MKANIYFGCGEALLGQMFSFPWQPFKKEVGGVGGSWSIYIFLNNNPFGLC